MAADSAVEGKVEQGEAKPKKKRAKRAKANEETGTDQHESPKQTQEPSPKKKRKPKATAATKAGADQVPAAPAGEVRSSSRLSSTRRGLARTDARFDPI